MHEIDPVLTDFKATMEKVDAQMAKFNELCQNEKQVRKAIFYRAKHAFGHVERKKLQIQQLIRYVYFFRVTSSVCLKWPSRLSKKKSHNCL